MRTCPGCRCARRFTHVARLTRCRGSRRAHPQQRPTPRRPRQTQLNTFCVPHGPAAAPRTRYADFARSADERSQ
ncbi:hypothetical protein [Lysobacter gummosus]|uniref:hypothetical protein n=1 Tax=Lysobacter gummosus TaxID=262324 RepID=UPI00362F023B